MGTIQTITSSDFSKFQNQVENVLTQSKSLESAAQAFAQMVYDNFKESVVLSRVFVTIPFANLPAHNKDFVQKLAQDKKISHLLNDQTPVLSLLGTCGEKSEWGSRYNSRGHVGIPLVSKDFIELIPMISRLLKSMGLSLEWINSSDTEIVAKNVSRMAGLFYVPDAKVTVDEHGRKIIAAQDFVTQYKVKTVFGFGGGYITGQTFMVAIVFTRETISEDKARRFMTLANTFKTATMGLVSQAKIFS